ncbi:hypothetical protein [Patiriisocius sp. Uisw_017]|jgi:cell division protein FtsB|uniref:hypothetical protein n=1 Tax=Patiriisocius sp. Uisw_017 TaxID=3230968 RepID=UPI0039EB4A0F
MTTETTNNARFKVLIGVLSALLISLAVYTFILFKENKETVSSLEKDKIEIEYELESLIQNYNEIIQDNELKDKDLLAARERIEVLLDSVKDAEANVSLIKRYKAEIGRLKDERKKLFRKADSLISANQRLTTERDSTLLIADDAIRGIDSANMTIEKVTKQLEKAALIGITNLKGDAVIVRNTGKIVDTPRASRADKIRACYTLAPNELAEIGDRMIYVQVINPNNNVIGENAKITFDNGLLTYSATTNVFFEGRALDVCTLIDGSEEDLIEGSYVINVFDKGRQIGSTRINLK